MHLNGGYRYREVLTRRGLGDGLGSGLGARPGEASQPGEPLQSGDAPQDVLGYLSRRYPHSSRADWQRRLDDGEVTLDGRVAGGREVAEAGQELVWHRPPWAEADVPLDFEVVYQDDELLAVVKPSGLPTLPGGGFLDHTLLHLVRKQVPEASPLHRLGRGTSGLVLFARTRQAAARLSQNWRDHEVHKTYLALGAGQAAQSRYDIRTPIGPVPHPRLGTVFAANPGGKASRSVATVTEQRADSVLFSVDLLTGRPHQIRIHLAAAGHPLVGDPLYAVGGRPLPDLPGLPGDGGYLLHASVLSFTHPLTGQELTLHAPAPAALEVTGSSQTEPL